MYVVWGGENGTKETVIKEAALHSGGAFFVSKRQERNNYVETVTTNAKPLIAFWKNIRGVQRLRFPVDSHINGIHVTISASVFSAAVTSPEGNRFTVYPNRQL